MIWRKKAPEKGKAGPGAGAGAGAGRNRGRAVCGGLVAGALRLGCGLAPLPGPRRFVLSANGKRPRRRSPSATLPALVWAAAFPLALGCAVPLWRGPDLGRGWRRCLLCVAHVRRPRLQSIKMIELRHATICPPIAAPYKNLCP